MGWDWITLVLLNLVETTSGEPMWVATLPLIIVFLGSTWWVYKKVMKYKNLIDDLNRSVYGNERDNYQDGLIDELQNTQRTLERIEDRLDELLDD